MKHLKYLFSATLFACTTPAFAEFHPIIVTFQQGSASDAVKAGVIELLSDAIQKGTLRSLASGISGTGERFKNRVIPGTLGGLTKAFTEIDKNVDDGFRAFKNLPGHNFNGANWSFEIHMTWTDRSKFPPLTEELGGRMFAMLWTLGEAQARNALQKGNQDALASALTYANTIPIVNGNEVPGGLQSFFEDGVRAYADIAPRTANDWIPLYMGLTVSLLNNELTLNTTAIIKPAELNLKLDDFNLVSARSLKYEPSRGLRTATHINLSKTYGSTRSESRSLLKVTFGNISSNDIRSNSFCKLNCDKFLYQVPTLSLKLTPSFAAPEKMKVAASLIGTVLSPFLDFFVLIKQIVIDFTDPAGPKVLPDKSQMVFISRQQIGAEEKLQVLNSSEEIRDGYNLYDKLIGHALEDRMTGQIRDGMSQLNNAADQKLNSSLEGISQLFK